MPNGLPGVRLQPPPPDAFELPANRANRELLERESEARSVEAVARRHEESEARRIAAQKSVEPWVAFRREAREAAAATDRAVRDAIGSLDLEGAVEQLTRQEALRRLLPLVEAEIHQRFPWWRPGPWEV
jgi:hypothetical protein